MIYYEIRDPLYGFIKISDWERQIIDSPVFQRLRRVKQLAWTDYVYPSAGYSRFEHSLGVMHVATKMFDAVVEKEGSFLKERLKFEQVGLERDRALLRKACLLHDIGHAPFSHAGEDLMVTNSDTRKRYQHENYSAAVVRYILKDVIENHDENENYHITAEEIAQFLEGSTARFGRSLLWRDLLSSQLDADRADYLLRDSYHCGVTYGHYDLNRLIVTLGIGISETGDCLLAVEQGGIHVAEALIWARYQMFTQVYFQHTRRAYDHHVADVLAALLQQEQENDFAITDKNKFPPPTNYANISKYLKWDDWKVYGLISNAMGGDAAYRLRERKHFRAVYQTKEIPDAEELDFIQKVGKELDRVGIPGFIDNATKSWYKTGKEDIQIFSERDPERKVFSLSSRSSLVKGLVPVMQYRIYVPSERKKETEGIIARLREV